MHNNLLKSRTSFISSEFEEQMVWFEDNLLKDYIKWYTAFIDPKNERKKLISQVSKLGYGNILFNSKIGFNFIKKVDASEHTCKLNLSLRHTYNLGGLPYNQRLVFLRL